MSIRESALSPPMFKKIWEEHPERCPPMTSWKMNLRLCINLTPDFKGFYEHFKKTMDDASVYESDITGDENHFVEDFPITIQRWAYKTSRP